MVRACRRSQPGFEVSESRLLTSVAGARVPGSVENARSAEVRAPSTPISLQGLISGQFVTVGVYSGHGVFHEGHGTAQGRGELSSLGSTTMSASLPSLSLRSATTGSGVTVLGATGSLTLSTVRGSLTLAVSMPSTDLSAPISFVIEGGTGAFKGASGSGVIQLAQTGPAHSSVHKPPDLVLLSSTIPVALHFQSA
jgi:hypothetical protein